MQSMYFYVQGVGYTYDMDVGFVDAEVSAI